MDKKSIGQISDQFKIVANDLKFGSVKPQIVGSRSRKNIKYPSDYDFVIHLDNNEFSNDVIWANFKKIIDRLNNDPNKQIYIIEVKIESDKKYKWYDGQEITKDDFIKKLNNLHLIKIDLVVFTENNTFVEASCNYEFLHRPKVGDIEKELKDDIEELRKEGKYWKILKRLLSYYSLDKTEHKKQIDKLYKILNSNTGYLNLVLSNLQAIELIKNRKDAITQNRIDVNLKSLGITKNNMGQKMKELEQEINEEGRKYIKEFPV